MFNFAGWDNLYNGARRAHMPLGVDIDDTLFYYVSFYMNGTVRCVVLSSGGI